PPGLTSQSRERQAPVAAGSQHVHRGLRRRSGGVHLPRGRGGAVNEVRALLIAAAQSKPGGAGQDAANALIALVAIFVATKLLGEIAQSLRQPIIIAEWFVVVCI